MNDIHLASGSDWEVLVWLIVMALWGVGKLLGQRKKTAEEEEMPSSPAPASAPRQRTMTELIETMKSLQQQPPRPVPVPVSHTPPPPPVIQPPPRQPEKQKPVSMFARTVRAPAAQAGKSKLAIPRTMHQPSVLGMSNALTAVSSALKLPSSPLAMQSHLKVVNPNRPDWRTQADLRKAIVAAALLAPPPYQ